MIYYLLFYSFSSIIVKASKNIFDSGVKRNSKRFNEEGFMFQLTEKELEDLRCQNGTAKLAKTRSLPFVFTEQGVYMLATVINSKIAVEVNKALIKTFTKLREFSLHYNALAKKIIELERKGDKQFKEVFKILDSLVDEAKNTDEKVSIPQKRRPLKLRRHIRFTGYWLWLWSGYALSRDSVKKLCYNKGTG